MEARSAERVQSTQTDEQVSDPYEDKDGVVRIFYEGKWYIPRDIETILVLGVDDMGKQKDYGSNINHAQADFLLLLLVNHETKQYTEIDHYAALSMDAIGIMNDQVGGVTVTVPVDMTKYDAALAEGATVTLDAEQAETFVRSRKDVDDSTNLSRMKRQQLFMSAWKTAMLSRVERDTGFVLESILMISEYLVSDMTAFELSDFANAVAEYEDQGIKETAGKDVAGETYMEFYVDEDLLNQQVVDLFYQENRADGK